MRIFLLLNLAVLLAVCERPPDGQPDHSSHDHANTVITERRPLLTESSAGAAQAPIALQYVDTLIALQNTSIEMLLLVNTRSMNGEIRQLATERLDHLRDEKAKFDGLREEYFKGADHAVNIELPGVAMLRERVDAAKLISLKAAQFDQEFMRQINAVDTATIDLVSSFRDETVPAIADTFSSVAINRKEALVRGARSN